MKSISIINLLYLLIPVGVVALFYFKWIGEKKEVLLASLRMIIQLLIIGYLLDYIFNAKSSLLTLFIVFVMIVMASFIALRNISLKNRRVYIDIFVSIFFSGIINLFFVIFFVLELHSLNSPRFVIPIAGMIFMNCMNAVSLVAERFEKEIKNNSYEVARANSFKASLIPQINSFLAVGLVSLPGMMTGQILSGVDPIIAVRYQIMVMFMVLGSAGISSILYLLQKK